MIRARSSSTRRPAVTLVEILISIMIMGVGLISLATLFPLGLIRLREAQRNVRSTYLAESAECEIETRNLLAVNSFLNPYFSPWYSLPAFTSVAYNPFSQDSGSYSGGTIVANGVTANPNSLQGLPVAYDPLWRQTANGGYYIGQPAEARFASGMGYVRNDPGDGNPASAWGLQRITNFNPLLGANAVAVQEIFVSPEDLIVQDTNQVTTNILDATLTAPNPTVPVLTPSPAMALSTTTYQQTTFTTTNDWRFTWMFTGQQTDVTSGSVYTGDIVVFENRPFAIDFISPFSGGTQQWVVAGEPVVEAVFGFSSTLFPSPLNNSYGYGRSDRVVLLRWPNTMPDPEIRLGGWIADVTYERNATVSATRNQYDIYPMQRCNWYQIVKKTDVEDEATGAGLGVTGYRALTVYTATPLKAKTLMSPGTPATPLHVNAALVSPYVVNVIPRTLYTR